MLCLRCSGMDDLGLTAYAAGLLGEYLSQAWQDKLAAVSGRAAACMEISCCHLYRSVQCISGCPAACALCLWCAQLAAGCEATHPSLPPHRLLQALDLPEDLPPPVHAPPAADYDAQVRLLPGRCCSCWRLGHATGRHLSSRAGDDAQTPKFHSCHATQNCLHSSSSATAAALLQPQEKRVRLDPKEAARQKAAATRQAAKVDKMKKEASGMRKLSAFFGAAAAAKK